MIQSAAGIFISQRSMCKKFEIGFRWKNCNYVSTSTKFGLKFVKDSEGRKVDSSLQANCGKLNVFDCNKTR